MDQASDRVPARQLRAVLEDIKQSSWTNMQRLHRSGSKMKLVRASKVYCCTYSPDTYLALPIT